MDHGDPKDIIARGDVDSAGVARGSPKLPKRSTELRKNLTFRGPGISGVDTFDEHCVFGNRVKLTKDQTCFLRNQVATKKPDIPYYVCTMKKANVARRKPKMNFSKMFTVDHIEGFLEEPMCVPVLFPQVCDGYHFVRFKKGKDGQAMITSQWKEIVKACNIKQNDICVFFFYNSPISGHWMCVFALN